MVDMEAKIIILLFPKLVILDSGILSIFGRVNHNHIQCVNVLKQKLIKRDIFFNRKKKLKIF